MATVKIPAGWKTPETTVELDAEGTVTWQGRIIGKVWKGTRTYSPPTHKNSRIVKYHKQVPEWHAGPGPYASMPKYRADTRQRVIQDLIKAATEGSKP